MLRRRCCAPPGRAHPGPPGAESGACAALAAGRDPPDAPRRPARAARGGPPGAGAPGGDVSRGPVLPDRVGHRLIRHHPPPPLGLLLPLRAPLRLGDVPPAVLAPPAGVGRFRDPQVADHRRHAGALGAGARRLAPLRDDRFRRGPRPGPAGSLRDPDPRSGSGSVLGGQVTSPVPRGRGIHDGARTNPRRFDRIEAGQVGAGRTTGAPLPPRVPRRRPSARSTLLH